MDQLINDFSPGLFAMQALILVILLVLLFKFAWKPIMAALTEREEGIQNALDQAENARKEMQNLQADNERLLKEARAERDAMMKEAREIKDKIIADEKFNRWLVPPAALLIHLSIGMIYGFSVFWKRLTQVVGVECAEDVSFLQRIFVTDCDWKMSDLGWTFSLAIVFLGASAAIFGHWLEKAGPRKAGVAAAFAWGGGLIITSLGVYLHQLWIIWLGTGVLGGIGLGLGYISPVSTLIKWFPDRRGLATGMAIMGFGGGAMIGSPSAEYLMNSFSNIDGSGVWQTFLIMGSIYLIAMMLGAFGYRVPADGWKPTGWKAQAKTSKLITSAHVHVKNAHKTNQFWLLWYQN